MANNPEKEDLGSFVWESLTHLPFLLVDFSLSFNCCLIEKINNKKKEEKRIS